MQSIKAKPINHLIKFTFLPKFAKHQTAVDFSGEVEKVNSQIAAFKKVA